MTSETRTVAAGLAIAIKRGEIGVQTAVYRNGEIIADAWAGTTIDRSSEIDGETLFPILSATKAITAVAIHIQSERGLIDIDGPITEIWPEFGASGKAEIAIREVLSHRAGLAHMPPGSTIETMLDWDKTTTGLAQLSPWFVDGTRNAYHALSWGYIVGEIVHRSDPANRPFGQFVQQEICQPLSISDLWIGLTEGAASRCADVTASHWQLANPQTNPLRAAAIPPALGGPQIFQNRGDFRQACVPAGNGIANARSLARFYAMIAGGGVLGGVRLLQTATIEALLQPRDDYANPDAVLGTIGRFGCGGFQIGSLAKGLEPDPVVGAGRILWHHGGGGTYGWANLDTGLAGAICHNRLLQKIPGDASHPFAPLAASFGDA